MLALWAASPDPASALGTFTRHLTITIGAGVVGGPLANFPVLVDVTNADLRTTGNGGSVQSAAGYDIVFRGQDATTCAGPVTCMLDHEIELYDGAAGRVLAWVRVPSLVASTSVINMYYGNNLITSPTETHATVFDADYVGVWHLKELGTGKLNEYRDSSRYGNHGQGGEGDTNAVPKQVAGKIGNGQQLDNLVDGDYDFIDVGQDGSLAVTGNQISLEAWVWHNITPNTPHGCTSPPSPYTSCPATASVTNPYGIINHKGYNDGWRLYLHGDPFQCPNPNEGAGGLTAPCVGFAIPGQSDLVSSSQYGSPATDPLTQGTWHHVVGTYNNVEMQLYLDGQKLLASAGQPWVHELENGTCWAPSSHCGSIAPGGTSVTFDVALPAAVGAGDVLTFDRRVAGGTVENFLITGKPDNFHVTVSPAAAYNHDPSNSAYRITSPFKTGNLTPSLSEQHVWIGHGDQPQHVGWSSEFEGILDEVRVSRVARSTGWIATEYANQNAPGSFYSVAGPVGVVQGLPTLTTVYRSIGTNAAVLAGSGGSDRASASLGSQVVTFTGTSLPANIGQGDQLDFTGAPIETLYILSRDSATQVTVQTPAASAHTSQTFTVKRAYNSLAAWETSLSGDLVAANVRQVGVAYKDGVFNLPGSLTFSGSTTDPLRNIVLTTAVADRTRGTAGSGVVLNNGTNASAAIVVWNEDVTIERLEITGGSATNGSPGIDIEQTGRTQVVVRNCLIHDIPGDDGIWVADANSTVDIYDNFIYGTAVGIRLVTDVSPTGRVNIFNNTIYNNRTAGIASRQDIGSGGGRVRQTSPRVTLRNNILHTNASVDQDVARPFDAAFFCTAMTGTDPTTCSSWIGHISQPNYDNQLTFTSATRCLYVGSNDRFRGVAVHMAVNGTNSPDMQWDYWSGAAWSSLETGPFVDYNFQWDGFAYWPDDPPGWATRLVDVDTTPRYWARVCLASGAFGTLPTESIITPADVSVASRYNLATDYTGYYASLWHGVGVTGWRDTGGTGILFNSGTDLHLQSGSIARNAVLDSSRQDGGWESSALTSRFLLDIDYQARPPGPNGACTSSGASCWDVGADEWASTTEVKLMSFTAVAGDGSVTLEWRTGSELDNLGFHVYRGLSAEGPWARLTSSLIPGLGSSPLGQAYSWLDTGLANGTTYYYRLEDVDTSSRSTSHGPVSATPTAASAVPEPSPPGEDGGDGGGAGGSEREGPSTSSCPSWVLSAAPDALSPVCTRHGSPDSVSLNVLSRDSSGATLELHTGGFWALHDASGTVRVFVPGLEFPSDPRAPALPLRRALVDAVVGKGVQLVSAEAFDLQSFRDLRPSAVGAVETRVGRDGSLRPTRRALAAPLLTRGTRPQQAARLVGTVFQGQSKSAVVEITPVRFSPSGLVLAGTVRVRLAFNGVVDGESGTGSRGRSLAARKALSRGDVLAQLHTSRRGLYAVRFEQLFPQGSRALSTALLRLQRQGEPVALHVEPQGSVFGPASTLYFYADTTASSLDYSPDVAYELVRSSGARMATLSAPPLGAPVASSPTGFASFETNRTYQPGLLEAPDPWLWEYLPSGTSRRETFALPGLATASGERARLTVFLQGGSESGHAVDHHVVIQLGGLSVAETSFAGKQPHRVNLELDASLLQEGQNELTLVNVDDTGVSSRVYLDRFEVSYPQASTVRGGVFEGVWAHSGTVEVTGLVGPPVILRDSVPGPEGSTLRWLTGLQATGSSVRFQAEAGYRYLVVSPEALLTPRVARVAPSTLRDPSNHADYLVIAPQGLLEAASPLLERRTSQGLTSRAVAFEQIASEFGHGQESAEAIKAFLSYAYHSWQGPSLRYVLLLGDATDDPQHFLPTSWPSPLPALLTRTSYMWTVSDPALAAVNGDDSVPDLAIGRLPARTREEADALLAKLVAWEQSGQALSGTAVFVADTPDAAGDFEADVEDVRASFLADRVSQTLRVGDLGAEAKKEILGAFDGGASLMSYVGHGGTAVWSSSGVFASSDALSLLPQSRQPLLLTMNCLNGYFVAPNLDALPEALLKAEGRGVVASFSPSGLSLDGPAHEYHRALVQELASGRHERLGDALLAAQKTYAQSGLMPELLTIYQLLGDPALRIR